jgi:hypothetical protein
MKTKTIIIIKQISSVSYFKISLPDMRFSGPFNDLDKCRKSRKLRSSILSTFTGDPALYAKYNEITTNIRFPDYVKLHYPEILL